MNRKISLSAVAAAGMLLLCGCEHPKLLPGCYQRADRTDGGFVCVYEDLIFVRVRMPEDSPAGNGFRDWGGKYKIDDDGFISLDMDREAVREWNFYFQLRKQGNMIVVNDFGRGERYRFDHESGISQHSGLQTSQPSGFQPVK